MVEYEKKRQNGIFSIVLVGIITHICFYSGPSKLNLF